MGSELQHTPDEAAGADAELVEDGAVLAVRAPVCDEAELAVPLAFVDGVRRGDATLYQEDSVTSDPVRGIAGSHACGAVLVEPGDRPVFGPRLSTGSPVGRRGGRSPELRTGTGPSSPLSPTSASDQPSRRSGDRPGRH